MDSTYLFIDGAYFRECYGTTMQRFYGAIPPVNWNVVWNVFERPSRTYYYDSVDRKQVGPETSEERDRRVRHADQFHRQLNALSNWHVREGFVSRGRRAARRSQKAVDVQLAVDALEHAVAHNMSSAGFIAGDLDFEPLFFSLNRFGIRVTVYYQEGTASEDLLEAADSRVPMTLQTFSWLAVASFLETAVVPRYAANDSPPSSTFRIRTGLWNNRRIEMFREGGQIIVWADRGEAGENTLKSYYPADNVKKGEQAFVMHFGGNIQWTHDG
jgi:uncharacterized LabA/DUF88 family protein